MLALGESGDKRAAFGRLLSLPGPRWKRGSSGASSAAKAARLSLLSLIKIFETPPAAASIALINNFQAV